MPYKIGMFFLVSFYFVRFRLEKNYFFGKSLAACTSDSIRAYQWKLLALPVTVNCINSSLTSVLSLFNRYRIWMISIFVFTACPCKYSHIFTKITPNYVVFNIDIHHMTKSSINQLILFVYIVLCSHWIR